MIMLVVGTGNYGIEYYDKIAKDTTREWFTNKIDRELKYRQVLSATTLFSGLTRTNK